MSAQVLRDYQARALEDLRAGIARGVQRQLLVAPTGAGKTTIAAAMIAGATAKGGGVLFLAHRKELIDQCSKRLDGAGVDHGVVMAGHRRLVPGLPVQIGSVQTLARRGIRPAASVVIIDEAHHARAGTYHSLLEAYPKAAIIGLTATPWRLDGKGLGELFDELVVAARPHELIEAGHLVPYTGYAYDSPDVSKVQRKGADYDKHELEIAMGGRKLLGNVVQQWLEHAGGKRTVVFACSVAHSLELCKRFTDAGVLAEHVDGAMPKDKREGVLARLEAGLTQVVCNVNVLTEGWDLPELEVVVLARPTLSVGLYLQMVGRGLRSAPGKSICRIHDHSGCITEHGLPDLDRDYALESDRRIAKKPIAPLRICPHCFATYDPAQHQRGCPVCPAGELPEPLPGQGVTPEEVTANVTAVPLETLRAAQLPFNFEAAQALARERGYRPFRPVRNRRTA